MLKVAPYTTLCVARWQKAKVDIRLHPLSSLVLHCCGSDLAVSNSRYTFKATFNMRFFLQRLSHWPLYARASAHRGKWGQLTPRKIDKKLKSENMQKKSSFLCLCHILIAIRAGRCRERRYADHIFIQIYFRMHYFVVKFSQFSSPQAARGHWPSNQNPADVPDYM